MLERSDFRRSVLTAFDSQQEQACVLRNRECSWRIRRFFRGTGKYRAYAASAVRVGLRTAPGADQWRAWRLLSFGGIDASRRAGLPSAQSYRPSPRGRMLQLDPIEPQRAPPPRAARRPPGVEPRQVMTMRPRRAEVAIPTGASTRAGVTFRVLERRSA